MVSYLAHFIWLFFSYRILTDENRVRRQMSTNASCMVCGSLLGSTDRFCTPAVATWILVIKLETGHEIFNPRLEDWFIKNLSDLEYFACVPSEWLALFGSIY